MKKKIHTLALLLCMLLAGTGMAQAQADQALLGTDAPTFNLKNIDGKMVALDDFAASKGVILVFTCNHCPYSIKYEDRINGLDKQFKGQGFPVVAINPNDPIAYKADSYKNMQKRAKAKKFTFPYLVDDTQAIAKAYAATRTPHVYLLVREGERFVVRYVGAIDDNTDAGSVSTRYVEDAIAKLGSSSQPDPAYTKAVGCGIKWKKAE